jgi:hypothetical protein
MFNSGIRVKVLCDLPGVQINVTSKEIPGIQQRVRKVPDAAGQIRNLIVIRRLDAVDDKFTDSVGCEELAVFDFLFSF